MLESLVPSSTEWSTLAVMGRPQGRQAVGGQHPPSPVLPSCPDLSPSEAVLLHLMMKPPHFGSFQLVNWKEGTSLGGPTREPLPGSLPGAPVLRGLGRSQERSVPAEDPVEWCHRKR